MSSSYKRDDTHEQLHHHHHWCSKRFASSKPLCQPQYSFETVPSCHLDLQGSSLHLVENRCQFQECMAEMVLLCKEAVRRRRQSTTCSQHQQSSNKELLYAKPLSLEYIADRLDVDDPLWGYVIRSNDDGDECKFQGFVTVTTFTTWQESLEWNSLHQDAFSCDTIEMEQLMKLGVRKSDSSGKLAQELQQTVRCGDAWNEGIVWPRIAEISLLGGLKCGKTLLSLVIEKLERMNATATQNYDYVVLQATDNSIPFYESMGFQRVGCITKEPLSCSSSSEQQQHEEEQQQVVSSPYITYTTTTKGETPLQICKKHQCDVWDMVFLNQFVFPKLQPNSRLQIHTKLFLPQPVEIVPHEEPHYYCAKENDTPRKIAKRHGLDSIDQLIKANQSRMPELMASSRLKQDTYIQISPLDTNHNPYCHWTFPNDTLETSEPSYMMARRLHRTHNGTAAAANNTKETTPFESSLAVKVQEYQSPPRTVEKPEQTTTLQQQQQQKAPSPFVLFCSEQRSVMQASGVPALDITKLLNDKWLQLNESEKAPYHQLHTSLSTMVHSKQVVPNHKDESLFNKVVRLVDYHQHDADEFEYYYVLTFLPDLKWCHLAPLRKSKKKKRVWKLVDETEGKELDISASHCRVVPSRCLLHTDNADEEEWEIYPNGYNNTKPTTLNEFSGIKQSSNNPRKKKKKHHRRRPRKKLMKQPKFMAEMILPPSSTTLATNPSIVVRARIVCGTIPNKRERDTTTSTSTGPKKKKRGRPPKNPSIAPPFHGGNNLMIEATKNQVPNASNQVQSPSNQRLLEPQQTRRRAVSPETDEPAQNVPGKEPQAKEESRVVSPETNPTLFHQPLDEQVLPQPPPRLPFPPQDAGKESSTDKTGNLKDETATEESGVVVLPETTNPTLFQQPTKKKSSRQQAQPTPAQPSRNVNVNSNNEPFKVGDVVSVQARTWPGINKPGGIGRVKQVQKERGSVLYDVSYVLGGRETNVDAAYVFPHNWVHSA